MHGLGGHARVRDRQARQQAPLQGRFARGGSASTGCTTYREMGTSPGA